MIGDSSSGEIPVIPRKTAGLAANRLIYGCVGLLLAYSAIREFVAASAKPIWLDEMLTWTVCLQGEWRQIINALFQGADGQPPIFYVIERCALHVTSNKEIALRLPSILAFPCTLTCVFLYAKRRAGEFIALMCAISLLMTAAFRFYATDARPYSMVLACLALALVCYQRVSAPLWAVIMGASLALAESLHYFAILSMTPFAIAEVVYTWRKRKVRWRVWGALACALVPLLLSLGILTNYRAMYGSHFWSRYSVSSVPTTYNRFLVLPATTFGVITAVICFGSVMSSWFFPSKSIRGVDSGERDPVEGALMIGLLFLPITTFLITKILHGAMHDRYALAAVLGMALAFAGMKSLPNALRVIVIAFFGFVLCIHELLFWQSVRELSPKDSSAQLEVFVQKVGHVELPVAVADALIYFPLEFYANPEQGTRFVYLVDTEKAIMYTGADTLDRNSVTLRQYLPYGMPDFKEFTRTHPEFLMYVENPTPDHDWLSKFLPSVASMEVLREDSNQKVYLIRLKSHT